MHAGFNRKGYETLQCAYTETFELPAAKSVLPVITGGYTGNCKPWVVLYAHHSATAAAVEY